ncbi:MAG: CAF17-like 4Fe-4S cluster assembly/insertion protein YgfZ [Acidimicrobiales bacterium]
MTYRSVREGSTWAPPGRDRFSVEGPDAATYLQGQLSQDVESLAVGASTWSFLLDPSGKLGTWLRVTRTGDQAFVLDGDPGTAEPAIARLNRFKLRTKAEIEQLDPDPGGEPEGDEAEQIEAGRIEAGVPRYRAEIVDDVIPAELGQWLIDASVSFTKGGYSGQELVARVDSRGGNVPRHLRGLVVEGEVVPPVGAEIVTDPSGTAKVVGTVTSSVRSPELGPIALAFVHRTVEPPAEVVVRWDGGQTSAEVRELPLR